MLLYCRSKHLIEKAPQWRHTVPCPPQLNMATLASCAQTRGFASLSSLSTVHRTASLPLTSNPSSCSSSPYPSSTSATPALPPSIPTRSAEQIADQEADDAARDIAAVKDEIYQWKQVPLCSMDKPLDLVRFWEVIPF
jgi:hypothetical protein